MFLIRKEFTEEEIQKSGKTHELVESIKGISANALLEQIAFRVLKEKEEIKDISICEEGSVKYNNILEAGFIEEYFPTLEEYKKSIC
ncbi:hypothetical protein [Poseidonibacter ostreae]|uniref:Uncharacterized protein n=1 Tax=Poseidonibacter ostreae TaxID=2654171 RepID=A0A6L4WX62_9BACT|nr:hypothetical protein [Poseidonibacter ostreae]KAB7891449.1 hypothetical protein GBG19_01010 [Poseidonibacter ostreae]